MKHRAANLICAIILFSTALPLRSAAEYDPAYMWRTIHTKNFVIHYHDSGFTTALKLAVISEKHFESMTHAAGWRPWSRTHIVIVDSTDMANGYATPFPRNRIQIYMTPPAPDSTIGNYDDWLETVFIHEFTHILNIDTVSGIPGNVRSLAGRCIFPNLFVPVWVLEGSAVHQESLLTGYGRNNSTHTDMVLRIEVSEDRFKPVSRASVFPREWPVGSTPYLYGGAFVRYLEETKGTGNFAKYFHENGDNIIPYSDFIYPFYFFNKDAKDIYGVSFYDLWKEWEIHVKNKYTAQLKKIEERSLTEKTAVSNIHYNSILPVFSTDGSRLFYVANPLRSKPAVIAYDTDTGKSRLLFNVNMPSSICIYRDGSLLTADLEAHRSFSWFYEIFSYDGSSYKKTTSGLRAPFISYSIMADSLAYISTKAGRYSLHVITGNAQDRTIVNETLTQLTFPSISPDGKTIALTIKDGPGSGIALVSSAGGEFTKLTSGTGNNLQPTWHPDGTKIIFSSDRDGVFNLYEYSLRDGSVKRLTNVTGGAFTPAVRPDGKKIAFADYGADGHVISLMDYPAAPEKVAVSDPRPAELIYEIETDYSRTKALLKDAPYSAAGTLIPVFIVPLIVSEEIYHNRYDLKAGIFTMGMDALNMHSYQALIMVYNESARITADVSYTYSGLYPELSLGYSDDTLFYGDDPYPWPDENQYVTEREMNRLIFFGADIPWIHFNSIKYLGIYAAAAKRVTDIWAGGPVQRSEDNEVRAGTYISYDSLKFFRYSAIPSDGRTMLAAYDAVIDDTDGGVSYYIASAEYAEYIDAPGITDGSVLMAGLRGGLADENENYKAPFTLGRFTKGSSGFAENSRGIRGYPADAVTGYRFASGTLEYTVPLIQRDTGASLVPVMFRDLWMNIFTEGGSAWSGSFRGSYFMYSAGLELRARLTMGYHADIELFSGFARGFSNTGEDQVYFGIGTIFEGALKMRKHRTGFMN
jgi:Tol biopolymer transport system component